MKRQTKFGNDMSINLVYITIISWTADRQKRDTQFFLLNFPRPLGPKRVKTVSTLSEEEEFRG